MDVVDDSDNDSDYAPVEGEASESEHEEEVHIEEISLSRKRRMEDLFSDMHSEEVKLTQTKVNGSLLHTSRAKKSKKADHCKKAKVPKSFNALAGIFGKSAAKKMLNMKSSKSKSGAPTTITAAVEGEAVNDTASVEDDTERMRKVRARALEIAQNTLTKAVVVDKVKFAGKEIE